MAQETLTDLLGNRRKAVDAMLPTVGFVAGWLATGRSVGWGVAVAIALGALVAVLRVRRGERATAAALGMLFVAVAGLVALRTGRAADFFLVQLLANVASALAWLVGNLARWPLLGVVVGALLGQKARWRQDPALLRAYLRASWPWPAGYVLRVAVFLPLWWIGTEAAVVALGVLRVALSWPLTGSIIALSWVVLRRSLPAGHPGFRHPVTSGRVSGA